MLCHMILELSDIIVLGFHHFKRKARIIVEFLEKLLEFLEEFSCFFLQDTSLQTNF